MDAGFVKVWVSGADGKAAQLDFMLAILTAPEGARFEVGLAWDPEHKWRVYQRIGEKFLMMESDEARRLHRIYEKEASKPEWRGIEEGLRDTFNELKKLASEAYHKNQAGDVPPGGVEFMAPGGRA